MQVTIFFFSLPQCLIFIKRNLYSKETKEIDRWKTIMCYEQRTADLCNVAHDTQLMMDDMYDVTYDS